jgi:hypothetical protein
MPSSVAATAFTKIVLDERCYYKIRMLAVELLPRVSNAFNTSLKGLLTGPASIFLSQTDADRNRNW